MTDGPGLAKGGRHRPVGLAHTQGELVGAELIAQPGELGDQVRAGSAPVVAGDHMRFHGFDPVVFRRLLVQIRPGRDPGFLTPTMVTCS
jgi:hypothetical protein